MKGGGGDRTHLPRFKFLAKFNTSFLKIHNYLISYVENYFNQKFVGVLDASLWSNATYIIMH